MSDCLDSLAKLSSAEQSKLIASLSDADALELLHTWRVWARDSQLPPSGAWRTWMFMAGRGSGKTRAGAEWINRLAMAHKCRIALVGRTAADVRDVMVEGDSGLLACSHPKWRPVYEPSKRRITWPNGAIATSYSADEPDQLRGPQHHFGWADELAAWGKSDAWDQLTLGMRLKNCGANRTLVTTTPRPTKLVQGIIASKDTVITRGSTFDNAANLAPSFLDAVRSQYEGTRLGRQELEGELLTDTPGALWKLDQLDAMRIPALPCELRRIVVAIDPAVSTGSESDETGIVVAGLGADGYGYVLADHSGKHSPNEWAQLVVRLYREHKADCVVAEVNQGGDLVTSNLRTVDRALPIRTVHASRGKFTRAEPVASLYEQAKVRHLPGLGLLEDQMTKWSPDGSSKSPDRLDALVWAITELMLGGAVSHGNAFTVPGLRRRI